MAGRFEDPEHERLRRPAGGGRRGAVDALQSAKRIDAVLLDVTIPGFDSRFVADKVPLLQPEAKIVLTTAYSREMVMGSFDGARISGFIRKPYRLAELVQVLQGIVSH